MPDDLLKFYILIFNILIKYLRRYSPRRAENTTVVNRTEKRQVIDWKFQSGLKSNRLSSTNHMKDKQHFKLFQEVG
jgi:hypothetical protein